MVTVDNYNKLYRESGGWQGPWMRFVAKIHEPKREYLVQRLLKQDYKSIIDIGCGTGDVLHLLRNSGYQGNLVGIDIHVSRDLKRYSEADNIQAVQADLRHLAINSDAAIFFSSLHYARADELGCVIKNIRATDYHIVEAFICDENRLLNEKLEEKSGNRLSLFERRLFQGAFIVNQYRLLDKYEYPTDTDAMGRQFTYMHFRQN